MVTVEITCMWVVRFLSEYTMLFVTFFIPEYISDMTNINEQYCGET